MLDLLGYETISKKIIKIKTRENIKLRFESLFRYSTS